ncbi:MAG: hypothetical protein M1831_001833 [Alyxoria varia]|nr:MAG: hypothetical protein M1831_001833 [Alyxoria varia]
MKSSYNDHQISSPLSPSYRPAHSNTSGRPPSRNSSHFHNTSSKDNGPSSPQCKTNKAPKLHLSSLPRFHPANYTSSNQNSLAPGEGNANAQHVQGSLSPGGHSRRTSSQNLSEAQRQLYLYQREVVSLSRNPKSPSSLKSVNSSPRWNPGSPRLKPLGSPGAITPLELEDGESDYFNATSGSVKNGEHDAKEGGHGEVKGHPSPLLRATPTRRADSTR